MTFVALYRGTSAEDATIIGLSDNGTLVRYVAQALLGDPRYNPEFVRDDVVQSALLSGKRHALRLISAEEEVNANA